MKFATNIYSVGASPFKNKIHSSFKSKVYKQQQQQEVLSEVNRRFLKQLGYIVRK